jgi:hypothetical protein
MLSVDLTISSSRLILPHGGKKGLVAHRLYDYKAAFAGRARRLGVAEGAGLVFGQVEKRKGCVGGGWMGRGLRHR